MPGWGLLEPLDLVTKTDSHLGQQVLPSEGRSAPLVGGPLTLGPGGERLGREQHHPVALPALDLLSPGDGVVGRGTLPHRRPAERAVDVDATNGDDSELGWHGHTEEDV